VEIDCVAYKPGPAKLAGSSHRAADGTVAPAIRP
jgi:hypothetical protein